MTAMAATIRAMSPGPSRHQSATTTVVAATSATMISSVMNCPRLMRASVRP